MSFLRFILASLWHHRRVHLAVAAGVAVATSVIIGALLVGDSVRGSLRDLAVERLGQIDSLLVAEQPFRAALADQLARSEAAQEYFEGVAPLLFAPGTMATTSSTTTSRRATQLSILGCDDSFWEFGKGEHLLLADGECAITASIAAELQATIGDEMLLHLPLPDSVPADSTLGEKTDVAASIRLQIAAVLPSQGLARFSPQPSQHAPRNVFVPLATLQRALELDDKLNMLAIGGKDAATPVSQSEFRALRESLSPTLEDYKIHVDQPEEFNYLRITAERLVLPQPLVDAAENSFPDVVLQRAITYLANSIVVGERKVPYSTITGVDSNAAIGPLIDSQGEAIKLAYDEIVLNDWTAQQLHAEPGDQVTVTYYEPETSHGQLKEAEPLQLTLKSIVPLSDSQSQRTLASDPNLTPELPGVTDQRSISDWDLPFELVEKISKADEDYWQQYSTTPKAFVSYDLAKRLWTTRWGTDSVLRIVDSSDVDVSDVQQQLRPDPEDMGMKLIAVKRQALQAATGTTSFAGLFLGFSFFLMASAVMLIALLVRLGVESRSKEIGLLSAVGYGASKLRQLLLGEAVWVVFVGTVLGVLGGIGYARLMIHGLTTWWLAATLTPFLKLYVTPVSLSLGSVIGFLVALATIWGALRRLTRLPARQLMSGDCSEPNDLPPRPRFALYWLPAAMMLVAATLAGFALRLQGESQAGAFFGSGALVLASLLIWLRRSLRQPATALPTVLSLSRLAARNVRRNPTRTILSVGLSAVASFLIVALSAFRLAPSEEGTGGFDLMATSDLPIHLDLNSQTDRAELGFGDQENEQLTDVAIHGFRIQGGEDASCLNLYQTTQPQIVGVPKSFYGQSKFGWSATSEKKEGENDPWQVLDLQLGADKNNQPVVPVVLDKNTAAYSLHLSGIGAEFSIKDTANQPVTLRVVGLLSGSVFQGNVLMSEANLLKLYPESAGQRLFLIRSNRQDVPSVESLALLELQLQDYGFDAVSTTNRLAEFLAVQNTYLSTFQSLGALGLLLGTLGLAVAQLRSVLERRSELALMRSAGFRRSRLAEMVLGENFVLLLSGLGIGCLAALVAVLPHWFLHSAETPWATLGMLLTAIILAGVAAGWLAVRAAVRAPLLPALRGD